MQDRKPEPATDFATWRLPEGAIARLGRGGHRGILTTGIYVRVFHNSLNGAGACPRAAVNIETRRSLLPGIGGGKPPFTVGRGPVPRHATCTPTLAGDRPPRYGENRDSSLCSSGSPDPDPFGSGCSRTTEGGRCLPVFARPPRRDKYRNGDMKHPHLRPYSQ